MRLVCCLLALSLCCPPMLPAQPDAARPKWWYGLQVGGNLNFYDATLRNLDNQTQSPAAFTLGFGPRVNGGLLIEYQPTRTWGGALTITIDGRGGAFEDIHQPGTYSLSTAVTYIAFEPMARYTPPESRLYFFAGPHVGFAVKGLFDFTRPTLANQRSEWTNLRSPRLGAQLGIGYDIPLVTKGFTDLSPFLSAHIGQGVRESEDWDLITVRAGIQLKIGVSTCDARITIGDVALHRIVIPLEETFPLLNYVFFDRDSVSLPSRYRQLSPEDAVAFIEEELYQADVSGDARKSARQLFAYENVLNVLGSRMRSDPTMTVTLRGVVEESAWSQSRRRADSLGRAMANAAKRYVVRAFGIKANRIVVRTGTPSVESCRDNAGSAYAVLCDEENRRVEIVPIMRPVKLKSERMEVRDSLVMISVGGRDALEPWALEVVELDSDLPLKTSTLAGGRAYLSAKDILGGNSNGEFVARIHGECRDGVESSEEAGFRISTSPELGLVPQLRYSVLFEFDTSRTVRTYEKFLRDTVARAVESGSRVFIHGHADTTGEIGYNDTLSNARSKEVYGILKSAFEELNISPRTFEFMGFGKETANAPFGNEFPEERFLNRTVIIDIELPEKRRPHER